MILPAPQPTRLVSLDCLRGLTVAAMVLVTDPGTYSAVYPPLIHAAWTGATPADMIFPSFLVITGTAMTLSFAARLRRGATHRTLFVHVFRRTALLILLGLILNGFPDFNPHTLRVPGILQRIGLCYLFGSLLYLAIRHLYPRETSHDHRRTIFALVTTTFGLLTLYWLLLKAVPVPGFGAGHLDTYRSLPAYIDRVVFTIPHLWPFGTTPGIGVTFDPEGLLSTLPALSTLLLGILAGEWLRAERSAARKAAGLALAGIVLFTAGLALSPAMPLIKKLWTPTFALLSGGVALTAFALFYFLIDIKQWRAWTPPALIFGTNAILAFTLSTLITTLLIRVQVAGTGAYIWFYRTLFLPWLPPRSASLAYALAIVLLNLLLLYPLYRKRLFLRI